MYRITKSLRLSDKRFCRWFQQEALPLREGISFDTVIVGAGPSGLASAIRLKQLANEQGKELSVCVVEKASEVGAHILSGNVFEPRALEELFPNWKELEAPLETKVTEDTFLILPSEKSSFKLPNFLLPRELHNDGNYVISLSQLVRWLATQAEALGVEIYPGFAADEVLYHEDGSVRGIATKDAGIGKDGKQKDTFTRGVELTAKQTLFAEGCRGSCTEEIIAKFKLRADPEKNEQSYGLGIKEVWKIPKEKFKSGFVQHTLGWPLQASINSHTFGGTFLYHQDPDLVLIGMVVGLDYENPHTNPYREFQRWKHHPSVAQQLEGGDCIAYGARTLNEGGFHSIPKLTFPGGALIGCSAGFLNSVKIKGSHTAMKSGMLAAEAIFPVLTGGEGIIGGGEGVEVKTYEEMLMKSWIADELKVVRNSHAAFKWGTLAGMVHTAFSTFLSRGNEPWTLRNRVPDSEKMKPAKDFKPIEYPKPDGVLSFDLLTNLQRSGTSHDHDQPSHLRVKPGCESAAVDISLKQFAGPEQRFCPAGVYEFSSDGGESESGGGEIGKGLSRQPRLVINAQNCVHCKCCSVKMPTEYIKWTVPEGGGGPNYTVM